MPIKQIIYLFPYIFCISNTYMQHKIIFSYRYPLLSGLLLSPLPFEPSRNTLCLELSCSWNGLRCWRFRGCSNWLRYNVGGIVYCEYPLRVELFGFMMASHSCFIDNDPELVLCCGVVGVDEVPAPPPFPPPPPRELDRCWRLCGPGEPVSMCVSCDCDCCAARRPCSVDSPLTCRFSAAFRKLLSASCDTCTSPLYINSSRAAIFSDEVASRMTTTEPLVGADSNSSAKFFEHAARMSLCALKTVPANKWRIGIRQC